MRFIFSSATASEVVSDNSLGFPCAVKLLAFFVNVLKRYTAPDQVGNVDGGSDDRSPMGPSADGFSASRNTTPASGIARTQSGIDSPMKYLGDTPPDGQSAELLLALKIINCMVVSGGDMSVPRQTILNCLPLLSLIRDDLGLCLILLAGRTDFPPVVLQSVLSLFSTLVLSFGPVLYVLVEAFLVHVYMKSLNHLHTLLDNSPVVLGIGKSRAVVDDGASINIAAANAPTPNSYSIGHVEVILESLLDTLSDSSFLAMVFISFDCDPSRGDILKPMLNYLCKCSRYALAVEDSYLELGALDGAAHLALQCLLQVVTALGDRCIENSDLVGGDRESARFKYDLSLHLRATRASKKILQEASLRFVKKPQDGLRFLQSLGALPTPLAPESVAKFLRLSCDIPKDVVGSYLGELGKDDPSFEGDAKDFHREVLNSYVRSFPLSGQNILSCVRVFLSAFRLPGEAQQIDRILNAFSEHCFDCCVERTENIIENAEIAYVLSFSLIMLNTDRHNVNIRADRKMTLEQFIKNNTNYGRDLKQTKDLPRDYLESFYQSISEYPLRTENRDETGVVTVEGWMDAQQQAMLDIEKGLLTMINYDKETLETMRNILHATLSSSSEYHVDVENAASIGRRVIYSHGESSDDCKAEGADQFLHPNLEIVSEKAVQVVLKLLTSSDSPDIFDISSRLFMQQSLVDADIAECIWLDLLPVIACPFMMTPSFSGRVPSHQEKGSRVDSQGRESSLAIALAIAMAVIKIADWYSIPFVGDAIVVLFGEFAKVLKNGFVATLFDKSGLLTNVASNGVQQAEKIVVPIVNKQPEMLAKKCLKCLVTDKSARGALFAILKLVHIHPQYLSVTGWTVAFQTMSVLRDIEVLPSELVQFYVLDPSFDGIPPPLRDAFEMKMNSLHVISSPVEEPKARIDIPRNKKSLLSFQGLGEALFGRTDVEESSREDAADSPIRASFNGEGQYDVLKGRSSNDSAKSSVSNVAITSRWDYGYSESRRDEFSDILRSSIENRTTSGSDIFQYGLEALTGTIEKCGIAKLITESKFIEDAAIMNCVGAIVNLTDNFSGWGNDLQIFGSNGSSRKEQPVEFDWSWDRYHAEVNMVATLLSDTLLNLPEMSVASSSWLEVVLVEIVVRNRDRISVLWPALAVHYIRSAVELSTISSNASASRTSEASCALQQPLGFEYVDSDRSFAFTYVDERRVVGILKIASKMFSRTQHAPIALNLLHALLCGGNAVAVENYVEWFGLRDFDGSPGELCTEHYFLMSREERVQVRRKGRSKHEIDFLKSWPKHIIQNMTAQIAVELWQMLTLNVSTLCHIHLAQWQQLFDIIAIASGGDAFAAGKAYEVMAWLIHEPRLRGEVPVFSLIGVRPLLTNSNAHDSIAIGAIELLTHLHSRLEVLVKSDGMNLISEDSTEVSSCRSGNEASRSSSDGSVDSPALWESCWVPILQVMAVGVLDHRVVVQLAAAKALSAAVLDCHSYAVPTDVLVSIISTVLVHTVAQLNDRLLDACVNHVSGAEQDACNGIVDSVEEERCTTDDGESTSVALKNKGKEDSQSKVIISCGKESEIMLRVMCQVC